MSKRSDRARFGDTRSDDVGWPVGLPDFVEPDDVVPASFDASSTWGEDAPVRPSGPAPSSSWSSGSERSQRASRGFGDGPAGRGGDARRGTKKSGTKKRLTWQEKQARREKRAEARRAEERAECERDPLGFAREIVLRQLTAAPKSRRQLAEKLRAKEVEEDVIDAVLDRMEDVGLVDDAAYAGMLVRSQVASRGLARRALAQELRRKGFDDETAATALEQVSDDDERRRALELAHKKMRTMGSLAPDVEKRRLAGLLARKGYSGSLVWSVIAEVQHDAMEQDKAQQDSESFEV